MCFQKMHLEKPNWNKAPPIYQKTCRWKNICETDDAINVNIKKPLNQPFLTHTGVCFIVTKGCFLVKVCFALQLLKIYDLTRKK